jgi:hypothetical protein
MTERQYKIKFEVDNKEAVEEINEVNEGLEKTQTDMDAVNETGDRLTGGLVTRFRDVVNVLKTTTRALKTMKGALIATGIGAFAVAVAAVTSAFTNSEEGQNRFNRLMLRMGVIVGNVMDVLEDFGKSLLAVGKILTGYATLRLDKVVLGFDELKESISDTVEGIKEFGAETQKELNQANRLALARAKADKIERELIVERSKADRDRADLLEKAIDIENFSVQERIDFLTQASELEDQITNKEIKLAQIRLDNQRLENSFGESKKEDLELEAQLEAELINLKTAQLTKQKEVTSQIIAFRNEEKAASEAAKAAYEAEIQAQEDALKSFEERELEALAITEELKTELAVRKSDERYEALIELAKQYGKDTYELETAQILARQDILLAAGKDAVEIVEDTESTKHDVLLKFAALGVALATEGSNSAKALGIAQAIISTYVGAAQVLSDEKLGLAGKIAGVATVLATGFTQVKAIRETQIPVLSVGGVTAAGSSPAPQIQPPSFNVVGASPINQLTEAIAGQQQEPIKAYVVESEVTSAQEAARKRFQISGI